jgi:hypothetical protein
MSTLRKLPKTKPMTANQAPCHAVTLSKCGKAMVVMLEGHKKVIQAEGIIKKPVPNEK